MRLQAVKRVIAKDKKATKDKLKKLKDKLKNLKRRVNGKAQGEKKVKRKKGEEDKAIEELEDAIMEAQKEVITGVMNEKTVDLIQEVMQSVVIRTT